MFHNSNETHMYILHFLTHMCRYLDWQHKNIKITLYIEATYNLLVSRLLSRNLSLVCNCLLGLHSTVFSRHYGPVQLKKNAYRVRFSLKSLQCAQAEVPKHLVTPLCKLHLELNALRTCPQNSVNLLKLRCTVIVR